MLYQNGPAIVTEATDDRGRSLRSSLKPRNSNPPRTAIPIRVAMSTPPSWSVLSSRPMTRPER